MIELGEGINPNLPDATFDLDGTVFKMTVLESYTEWLSQQTVFDPIPPEISAAKQVWKNDNTEKNYTDHLRQLVQFFIEQVPGKSVSQLNEAARIVANQQRHRRWNVTTTIIDHLRPTHNIMAVSLMPEWLMGPFTEDLDFAALIGSTYVTRDDHFTSEAHSIDKATEYLACRQDDSGKLDVHMGDTVGDTSMFDLAKRPILFNPSWTLYRQMADAHMTVLSSHKDVAVVINPGEEPAVWGPPFDPGAILERVRTKS